MKEIQTIIKFRKDFFKLNYLHSNADLNFLKSWAQAWCLENLNSDRYYMDFFTLAMAYFEKEYLENALSRKVHSLKK